jgi:zinc transport system permease protein
MPVIRTAIMKGINMDDFLIRALVAGIGVAIVAGPLGCFVVWRRMAYFGATLAHSALFGLALGLMLQISPTLAIVVVCVVVSVILVAMQGQQQLAGDTLLGILAHAMLALGLVVTALIETVRVDLMAWLFGDILAVNNMDLIWILGGGVIALVALALIWRPLLAMTVHEELAAVEGIHVARTRLFFMLIIAIVIAVAMKVVGVLLIVSLLIIPAAAARPFARTPEVMAILAVVTGCIAVISGLGASMTWDVPAGPAIVLGATLMFLVGSALRRSLYRQT